MIKTTLGYQVTALCSEGPMFRRFYVQKIFVKKALCSEGSIFRSTYVQKVLCSEGSIFRRFYVQKVLCSENICSKGPIFRRFYVQKVLYSDILRRSYIQKKTLFYFGTNIFQFQVNYNVRQQITASHFRSFGQRSDELLSCRFFPSSPVHNWPQFSKIAIAPSVLIIFHSNLIV